MTQHGPDLWPFPTLRNPAQGIGHMIWCWGKTWIRGLPWTCLANAQVRDLAPMSETHKYPSVEQEQPLYSISMNAPAARRNDFSFPCCFDFISAERSIDHHSSFTSHTSISWIYPLACDWLHRHAIRCSAANWFIYLRAAKEFQPQTDCTSLSFKPTPPLSSVCASICSMIACTHTQSASNTTHSRLRSPLLFTNTQLTLTSLSMAVRSFGL